MFLEVIVSVIEANIHTNLRVNLKGYRDRAVWISRPNSVRLLFVRLKSEVKKKKVDIRDALLARILDAAVRIKKHEVKAHLRRTTRDFRTRIAKCVEADVGFSKVL